MLGPSGPRSGAGQDSTYSRPGFPPRGELARRGVGPPGVDAYPAPHRPRREPGLTLRAVGALCWQSDAALALRFPGGKRRPAGVQLKAGQGGEAGRAGPGALRRGAAAAPPRHRGRAAAGAPDRVRSVLTCRSRRLGEGVAGGGGAGSGGPMGRGRSESCSIPPGKWRGGVCVGGRISSKLRSLGRPWWGPEPPRGSRGRRVCMEGRAEAGPTPATSPFPGSLGPSSPPSPARRRHLLDIGPRVRRAWGRSSRRLRPSGPLRLESAGGE